MFHPLRSSEPHHPPPTPPHSVPPPPQVPQSKCSADCEDGQVRRVKGFHSCCYDCIDCLPGTYQKEKGEVALPVAVVSTAVVLCRNIYCSLFDASRTLN